MWCERIIRNLDGLASDSSSGRSIDWADLEWNECSRPLKKQTRGGEPVRMFLAPGQVLHHRDVIHEDSARIIAVNVKPCEVIVAHVIDGPEMALLALELGHLHLPAQIENGQIAFIENESAMAVVKAMGIFWTKEVRRFEPAPVLSAPALNLSPEARVIMRSRNTDAPAMEKMSYVDDFPMPAAPFAAARNSSINA
jgi:urease accessory protein